MNLNQESILVGKPTAPKSGQLGKPALSKKASKIGFHASKSNGSDVVQSKTKYPLDDKQANEVFLFQM